MEPNLFVKDPDATLDYKFDWTAWLGEDSITDHEVTCTGCTLVTSTVTDDNKQVIAWVSGGEPAANGRITCQITTVAGRIDERTIGLRIKQL